MTDGGAGIVIFDIDGTLTDTTDVDVECYELAVREILGLESPGDWQELDDVTDPLILAEACRRADRRPPDDALCTEVARRIGRLLEDRLRSNPGRFSPIRGARRLIVAAREAGWQVGIATGAWRPSAEVKLRGAGIPYDGVPLATASERWARRDIIGLAYDAVSEGAREPRQRAGEATARPVYVGDGTWDGRAATSLGFGFVGVGSGARARALAGVGAVGSVADLADVSATLALLERAAGLA